MFDALFSGSSLLDIWMMSALYPKELSVGHLNIHHLANKVIDLNAFLSQSDFLCVSETRLSAHVSDDPNCFILWSDANGSGHTGTAVYVHDTIRNTTCWQYDLESEHVESIWFQVKPGRGPPIVVAFIYRKPSFVWFDEFVSMLDKVLDHKHVNYILLLGDFDIDMFEPHPIWESTLSLFNLHQCVQSATRVTLRATTFVDHIYVNNPDKIIRTFVSKISMSNNCPVPNWKTHYCNI